MQLRSGLSARGFGNPEIEDIILAKSTLFNLKRK